MCWLEGMTDKCVHTQLHKADQQKINLTQDEELTKEECFNAIVEGMKILGWDGEEEKRLPPLAPMSPYE